LDAPQKQRRWGIAAAAILAMLFCTLLYKYTLRAWFQADDFAWLGLRLQVHNWPQFLHAMFAPMAQGSIRPFSERAFFMGFSWLFGIHALPYRIAVYLTQLGVIALLAMVARRLCKSLLAAFVAPVLWVANSALATPLTWTCAYNEILCAGTFLLAFYALIRYVETGERRFNILQWIAFLLGFGVLEITVVYPFIAILYAALFARSFLRRTTLLLIPSTIFTLVFFAVRIKPKNEAFYALEAGMSTFRTLASYWAVALGPGAAGEYFSGIKSIVIPLMLILTVAIVGFAGWRALRVDWMPVFCLGWFIIALAPFLPIHGHLSNYYVTVPAIGLALLGGWAAEIASRSGGFARAATLGTIAIYLALQIPTARAASKELWARSVPLKRLVLGVQSVHERDPGKTILLDGVSEPVFWLGVYNHPFRLVGAVDVYITAESARKLTPYPELANVVDYALSSYEERAALSQNRALVYAVDDGGLRDITKIFKTAAMEGEIPRRIEVGRPLLESLLGSTWYGSEGDYRWMPKAASVRLGVPTSGEGEVRVEANCAPVQVRDQPLTAWVTVDGKAGPRSTISDCNQTVMLSAPVHTAPGTKSIEVVVHVDRTVRVASDQRDLGLAVRSIEVAPASVR
jgi:hypothetical protein